jgi:cyclophilin family peptidyl-prolyl cis-trans isomerase
VSCDPDPEGRVGKLALLFVLDQGKLSGARGQRFSALARDRDPVVRQAALRQIPGHRELTDATRLLTEALAESAPGTVAVAAEILSTHPERVDTAPRKGDATSANPELVAALSEAYRGAEKSENIGVRALLMDAVAALGVLGLMNELGRSCDSDNPSLREHAERALRALGQPARRCNPSTRPPRIPDELTHLASGKQKLVFSSDAGELRVELDAAAAPVAVTRVLDLVKKGFYDGTVVHRVVPGFIDQLGDPAGDGYGGAPLPPLRSELGPEPFEAGAVGMAQAGPDSASSQFFVTLGRFPHLDGESARIGHAGPGWERLVVGDRILKVRLEN